MGSVYDLFALKRLYGRKFNDVFLLNTKIFDNLSMKSIMSYYNSLRISSVLCSRNHILIPVTPVTPVFSEGFSV